jgi:putative ABC transport system substrate-binding protein
LAAWSKFGRNSRHSQRRSRGRGGWTAHVRVKRWGAGDDIRIRAIAAELPGKAPNVILALGTERRQIVKQRTSIIPIVFVAAADSVASELVAKFARSAGNITGFASVNFSFAGKWLSVLRDITPGTAKVMAL